MSKETIENIELSNKRKRKPNLLLFTIPLLILAFGLIVIGFKNGGINGNLYDAIETPTSQQPSPVEQKNNYIPQEGTAVLVSEMDTEKSAPTENYKASTQIKTADSSSGSFQLGNMIFSLPTRVSSLTDNGVEILYIDDSLIQDVSDYYVENSVSHSVLFRYDGIVFTGEVFNITNRDSGKRLISENILVSVTEDINDLKMKDNADHLFFPGGVYVKTFLNDAISEYGLYEYESEKMLTSGVSVYRYGHHGTFSISPTNEIVLFADSEDAAITKITQTKNILK